MTPDQILDCAADYIDERGHYKGGYDNRDGRVCILGALRVAQFGSTASCRSTDYTPVTEAFGAALALTPAGIVDWNDAPNRTQDEVTSTMRAVAATLRASTVTPETVTA